MIGVVVVRVFLVVVPEEHVEALILGDTCRVGIAKPPFAEPAGGIAGVVEQSRDRHLPGWKCEQADLALVGTAQNVPRVLTGHQHAA